MTSDISETGNEFAETACKLLIEYTTRLVTQKQELLKILERFRGMRTSKIDSEFLRQRYADEMHEFLTSNGVFETLIRKASQWVEHGKPPKPNLQMELEVRLSDFENTLQSMHHFISRNQI